MKHLLFSVWKHADPQFQRFGNPSLHSISFKILTVNKNFTIYYKIIQKHCVS